MIKKSITAAAVIGMTSSAAMAAVPTDATPNPAAKPAPGIVVAGCKACKPCNPCKAEKWDNPCNPCNPCKAEKWDNPCNPCNPCAAKAPCAPCNPCKPE